MKKINSRFAVTILLIFFVCLFANDVVAQCPMCRMAAESNLKNGGTAGRGLNSGILYMLATPYLFAFVLFYLWRKNRKEVAEDDTINADTNAFSEN